MPGPDLTDILALAAIILWPVIPIFWLPVHGFPDLFRRLGLLTYLFPAVVWIPLALLLYSEREFLLLHRFHLPFMVQVAGWVILSAGTALQMWTGRLLSLPGLMGMPEVTKKVESRFVSSGPYSIMRHPTYIAHTLMLAGIFLATEVTAVGIVVATDFFLINLVIIPLEERELSERFGPLYEDYKKKTPGFFPFTRRRYRGN